MSNQLNHAEEKNALTEVNAFPPIATNRSTDRTTDRSTDRNTVRSLMIN